MTSLSDAEVMEVAHQLRVAYKLKRTLRYDTTRDFTIHNESVAEHVFALLYLSYYFLPLEDPEHKLDVLKIHLILLAHDFPEMEHGDVPMHWKTPEHEERERLAAAPVFEALPQSIGPDMHLAWKEYEYKETEEARFVYALDKIEPLFELLDPVNVQSLKRLGFTYDTHTKKKLLATEGFPVMRRFVHVMSNNMRERNLFIE